MGLIDRFKKLFQKEDNDNNKSTYRKNEEVSYATRRNDGTILEIAPVLDQSGMQTYEMVYNSRLGKNQAMPKFRVKTPELKEMMERRYGNRLLDYSGIEMLIDINPNSLKNVNCLEYVSNILLNRNRISKVISDYDCYAGGLRFDAKTGLPEKYIDKGILDGRKMMKENKEQARINKELENAEKNSRYTQDPRENAGLLDDYNER